MSGIFDQYPVALLDASFFVGPFPEEVRQGLMTTNVYVADTFRAELMQYQQALPRDRAKDLAANITFLNSAVRLKTLDLDSFGERSRGLNNDAWGVLALLVSMNAKFVCVTADQMLLQRVALLNMAVDIYDLNRGRILSPKDLATIRESLMSAQLPAALPMEEADDHIAEGTLLYRRGNEPIFLGKEIKSGLESNLYQVSGDRRLVAKVFKMGKLSPAKFANIQQLQGIQTKMNAPWALFPLEILYYDREFQRPAGFTEVYAHCGADLDENPLYLGDIDLPQQYLDMPLSATLELCLKVVRQVCCLNVWGFLVSDFNMGNFAAGDSYIQMWDTDSFGYGAYFSGYCAGNKTSREYDTSKKLGAMGFCSENLYLFVFSLLSLGDAPISEFSGKFKYDNPNYGALYRRRLFPAELWWLFEEVFRGKRLPSAALLLQQLQTALDRCRQGADPTYTALLKGLSGPREKSRHAAPKAGMPKWLIWLLITVLGTLVAYGCVTLIL